MTDHGKAYLMVILGALVVLGLATWWQLKGGPPRKIVFAAGSADGAYYAFAQQYARRLSESGLEVEVLETKGSMENLALVESGKADIAFAQSGLKGAQPQLLRSLGSMFYEPVWVFIKGTEPAHEFTSLKGKRIGVGEVGSGTREVAAALLADNKLTNKVKMFPYGGAVGKDKLIAGDLDALFLVGAASISTVKELANRRDITLVDVVRAKAYSRYHDSLASVMLYRGMLNLAEDIPERDQELVATAANLVVSEDFHYALVTLILQTAKRVHGAPGPFHTEGDFPSPRLTSFPLVPEAEAYYSRGPSFFYRNLPFYVAAALDRLIIVLLPLITLMLPLGRILPPLLAWFQNRGLYGAQTELSELEVEWRELSESEAKRRLTDLEGQISELKSLPPNRQNDLFLLQMRAERLRASMAVSDAVSKPPGTPHTVAEP